MQPNKRDADFWDRMKAETPELSEWFAHIDSVHPNDPTERVACFRRMVKHAQVTARVLVENTGETLIFKDKPISR